MSPELLDALQEVGPAESVACYGVRNRAIGSSACARSTAVEDKGAEAR